MKRVALALIFLLITSLACVFSNTATRIPINVPTRIPGGTVPPTRVKTPRPTSTEPTKTPYPTSQLDPSQQNEINLIQTQVVDERGLQPKYPVPFVLLSPDELRQNVVADYTTGYSDQEAADDVLEYSTIGLLEPGFDLRSLMINLMSEQIAGFYDNETKEMFVVGGQGFDGLERYTYSHEYTHVLQDQNYDLQNGLELNQDTIITDSERYAANLALIEGDATLSQTLWLQYYATAQDKQQVESFYSTYKSPIYDSAPAFLKDNFGFPYNQGAKFVLDIYENGGWPAVDDVYNYPPVSTEQILHPNLYPSDKPIPVDIPDLTTVLGEGWREVSRNQMGEWYTYLILARGANADARLDDATGQDAAAGWGGDEYVLLHNDATGETVFVMKTVWDSSKDAAQFATAFGKYATNRFGVSASIQGNTATWNYSGGYTSLYQAGDTTVWITAPNANVAQSVTTVIQP